jgi:hypothetical protein
MYTFLLSGGGEVSMRRIGLILVIAILVAGVALFGYFMGQVSFSAVKVKDHLTEVQQKQVDIFLQMTSLLAGCATLALGGIGALIWERKKNGKNPTLQLLTAATGSALSLYFAYLSYRYLLWMLDHGFLDLSNNFVSVTSLVQFFAFFASIIALADFVFVT